MLLALETCFGSCSISIFSDHLILEKVVQQPKQQAAILVHMVYESLVSCNITYDDIKYIAISTGPGSFTGTRIGLSFASGIHLVSGAKVIGVNSLEIISTLMPSFPCIGVLPAGRGRYYTQEFSASLHPSSKISLVEEEEIISMRLPLFGSHPKIQETILPNSTMLGHAALSNYKQGKYLINDLPEIIYTNNL